MRITTRHGQLAVMSGDDQRVPVTRQAYRWEKTADGLGRTSVKDGQKHGEVQLTIDLDRLAELLGWRALGSKAGKSILAGGAIKAHVVLVRHVKEGA